MGNLKIPHDNRSMRTKFPGIVILGVGSGGKEFGMVQISPDDPPPKKNLLNYNDTAYSFGEEEEDLHEYYQINVFAQKSSSRLGNLSLVPTDDRDDDDDSWFVDPPTLSITAQGVADFLHGQRKAITNRMKKWTKKRKPSFTNLRSLLEQ